MPTPEVHAKLSASSAHRWLNCPPSVKLAEQFPSKTSTYAEAGRVAHSIAELKARKYFLEPMSTRTFNSRLKKLQTSEYYDSGMETSTATGNIRAIQKSAPTVPPDTFAQTTKIS